MPWKSAPSPEKEELKRKTMATSDDNYQALLKDLHELTDYLHQRGEKTRALSQKFTENAQNDSGNREFDLTQARMLDYQHHIWHEIGGLVEKLLKKYESS
jgi:hypothetical protein